MPHFKMLKLSVLLSILADFTDHYAMLKVTGTSEEDLKAYRDAVDLIQSEINSRNNIIEK